MAKCYALGCTNDATKVVRDIPVCASCRANKSVEVLQAERIFGMPIEALLEHLIKSYDTWEERYSLLGVSKVALFSWVRKYLQKTPKQAVAELRQKSFGRFMGLQTGVRDYLGSIPILIVPE